MTQSDSGGRRRRAFSSAWRRPVLTLALLLMLSAPSSAALTGGIASTDSGARAVIVQGAAKTDDVAFVMSPFSSWSS